MSDEIGSELMRAARKSLHDDADRFADAFDAMYMDRLAMQRERDECRADAQAAERKLAELRAACAGLKRGCDCGYDYRCWNCDTLLRVKHIAEQP